MFTLVQMGKIWKINSSGPARYDGNMERHWHIECTKCDAVDDVWLSVNIGEVIDFSKSIGNYTLIEYKIDFSGICDKCNSKKD